MAGVTIFLALVLGVSAAHKILAAARLANAAARLAGVPLVYGQMLSVCAAAVEGLAAISLLFDETRVLGASLATGIWAGYAVLLWLRRGQSLDCGCSFGQREKRVGLPTIARSVGLSIIGLTAILFPFGPITMESLFAGLGFLALYFALDELLAIPQPAWRHG